MLKPTSLFEKLMPLALLGSNTFVSKMNAYFSEKYASRLIELQTRGFSGNISVYLHEHSFIKFYYENLFKSISYAITTLDAATDIWVAHPDHAKELDILSAHSCLIKVKEDKDNSRNFNVSGPFCEKLLKDALAGDSIIYNLIYGLIRKKGLSDLRIDKLILVNSNNEVSRPNTIIDKLIYSYKIQFSTEKNFFNRKDAISALEFFAELKTYSLCLNMSHSGDLKIFSLGLEFNKRINELIQSIAACAELLLQANAKYDLFLDYRFNFSFNDSHCNSVIDRRVTVDQCSHLPGIQFYNCTTLDFKEGITSENDYLVSTANSAGEANYSLYDLVIKAIYCKSGFTEKEDIELLYQNQQFGIFDQCNTKAFLIKSLGFYDRLPVHLCP